MSAQTIRRAAALMQKRAEAATPGRWDAVVLGSEGYDVRAPNLDSPIRRIRVARCGYEKWETDRGNAEHIASWPPAVAMEVASWLGHQATLAERAERFGDYDQRHWQAPLTIALAYLGEPS